MSSHFQRNKDFIDDQTNEKMINKIIITQTSRKVKILHLHIIK